MPGDDVAVEPLALLREPLDEGGGVRDFALGFGQGLALLGGHQDCKVLLIGKHEIEPAAHDDGSIFSGAGCP